MNSVDQSNHEAKDESSRAPDVADTLNPSPTGNSADPATDDQNTEHQTLTEAEIEEQAL